MKKPVFPLIADGAFGTYYFEKTGDSGFCELANLTNEKAVEAIHREYIESGAGMIIANTFNVSSAVFPDEKMRKAVIEKGYAAALKAAEGTGVLVFADIGPMNDSGETVFFPDAPKAGSGDPGHVKDREKRLETKKRDMLFAADTYVSLGAKYFIFETQSSLDGCREAARMIKDRVPDSFIIFSFGVSPDGYTSEGLSVFSLIAEADSLPCTDALGINCVCGPAHAEKLISRLPHVSKPLSVMPNAGYPSEIGGRRSYGMSPDYFAERISSLVSLGASIVGGCCGTTPEHIRRASRLVRERSAESVALGSAPGQSGQPASGAKPRFFSPSVPVRKIIAAELSPPSDCDFSRVKSAAIAYAEAGADALTVTDSPLARSRADSVMTSVLISGLIRERGLGGCDVLPHISCRDKNSIALKGSLICAYESGISKAFIITGDPPSGSVRRDSIYAFNSYGLLGYISELNGSLFSERPFYLGAAFNPGRENFPAEIKRMEKKRENGAGFFMSQPIFSEYAAKNLEKAKKALPDAVILAGILPVASYKNALFLSNEVSGIDIDPALIEKLKETEDKEEIKKISLDYSKRIISSVYDICDGFYVMTPLSKTDFVTELIRFIRSR